MSISIHKPIHYVLLMTAVILTIVGVHAQPVAVTSRPDRLRAVSHLTFTLAQRTLSPAAVTVSPGQYSLRFRNGMFAKGFDYEITADKGRGTARIGAQEKVANTRAVVNLEPGVYELTVAGRPDLKSIITVKQ